MALPPFLEGLVSTLQTQFQATLTRSDILKGMAWMVGILFTGTLLSFVAGTPAWFSIMMAGLLAASIVSYLGTHLFCLFADRDALRSEAYSIQKMAIEHGFFGDSNVGTLRVGQDITPLPPALPASAGQAALPGKVISEAELVRKPDDAQ